MYHPEFEAPSIVNGPFIDRLMVGDSPRSFSSNFKTHIFAHDDDIPLRLLMCGELVGRMIGRGGAAIKQIRELSRAHVAVLEKETPQALLAQKERIVKIIGSRESKDLALRLILHKVKEFSLNELTGQKVDEWIDVTSSNPLSTLNDEIPSNACLLVPDQACASIIGTKGDTLKKLSEESGASVQVPREPVVGYPGQRRVLIDGCIREVRIATQLIHSVMKEMLSNGLIRNKHFDLPSTVASTPVLQPPGTGFASNSPNPMSSVLNPAAPPFTSQMQQGLFFTGAPYPPMLAPPINGVMPITPSGDPILPIRIIVTKDEAAWVVGKKGSKIQKLREDHVKVIIEEAKSPPFHKADRLITISGPTAAKHSVLSFILSDLEKQPARNDTLRLLIPADSFGIIMGKRGEQMKRITIATSANIQKIDPGPGGLFSPCNDFDEGNKEASLDEKGEKLKRAKTLVSLGREGGDQGQFRLLLVTGDDKQRSRAALMIVQLLDQRFSDDSVRQDHAAQLVQATNQTVFQGSSSSGISMSGNEAMLMQLAASTGTTTQRPVRMQILIPSLGHLTYLLGPGGQGTDLNTIGKRAGCEIQLGGSVPDAIGNGSGFPVLILSGSAVGNAFAFLLIQEQLLAMELGAQQLPSFTPSKPANVA